MGRSLLHVAATGLIAGKPAPTGSVFHVGAGLPAMGPEQSTHLLPTCDVQQAGHVYRAGFRSITD
ncbi:hypothetical protein EJA70_05460 [Pseudomonas sp. PB103]|nr:hypothetical protein EJA70_05460 [Pseudomonas sp. PB103]